MCSKNIKQFIYLRSNFEVITIQSVQQIFHRNNCLNIGEFPDNPGNLIACSPLQLLRRQFNRLFPGKIDESSIIIPLQRQIQSLPLQPIKRVSGFIRDPLLVDFLPVKPPKLLHESSAKPS